ncbi:hypothetical protein FRC04_001861 [Tulasnella sp. 424]|nr:hypothetical protein FRC04_001861 [Tulasnella sp. 424]KAG8977642.1 hypothetical protein FRC05_000898 [Tulasnella sp. 425]
MPDLRALREAAEEFFETDVLSVKPLKHGDQISIYVLVLDTTPDPDLPSEVIVRIFTKQRMQQSVDSEVATISFVSLHTQIPVARVFFHESTLDNPVGFQYIVQEKLQGEPLQKALDEEDEPEYELGFDSWHNLVSDYADVVSQLWRVRFDRIGALYEVSVGNDQDSEYSDIETYVGPTAETWFYRGSRRSLQHLDVGPWESSSDWLAGLISNEVRYFRSHPAELEKELEEELGDGDPLDLDVEWALDDAQERLRKIISLCDLGSGELGPDEALMRLSRTFGLFHAHLLPNNILVDMRTGHIKGITGWEDASVTPIWRIASVPYWLEWPGPESEWSRIDLGETLNDTKGRDVPWTPIGENGRRNGVSEEELAELRSAFCDKVSLEDPDGLFARCLEDGFFDQIKIIPHLLYNIWERGQVETSIEALEKWEAEAF